MTALAMLIALLVDWCVGWPEGVTKRIGHPVIWVGALIERLDHALNRPFDPPRRRMTAGAICTLSVVAACAGLASLLASVLPSGGSGAVLTGLLAVPLVAGRSLKTHVAAVFAPLRSQNLPAARRAVARIVGRDPNLLDRNGMSRAALESLAENTSDGVTAPLFWGALFGLPGIAGYKAINTLDSMIGHRDDRYLYFGRVAARLDDVANWIPARITGIVICIVAPSPKTALAVMLRDARRHRSPNAGWPEAALAGGLGIRLSGPRSYHDRVSEEPWLNAGARDPDAEDGAKALDVYVRSVAVIGLCLFVWALLTGGVV